MTKKLLDDEARYHPETGELLNGLARSLLSNDGRFEFPDPTPMEATVEFAPAASGMRKLVQEMVQREFSQLAEMADMETFADADDFEIDDDPLDPLTPWEMEFDPEVRAAVEAEKKRLAAGVPGMPSTGSGLTEGGGLAPPPSFSPSQSSADELGGPNVKRSVSNDQRSATATATDPGSNGAHRGERASGAATGGA